MPAPMTAEFFTSQGVPAEQAAAMAAEHNQLAHIRTPAAEPQYHVEPAARPAAPALPAPTAEAIEARIERYTSAGLKFTAAQVEQELRMEAQLDTLKGNRQAQWDLANDTLAHQTEQGFVQSIEAHMTPATGAHQYTMPDIHSPADEAASIPFRAAMFAAGLPVEIGNSIARQVNEAAALLGKSDDEIAAYCQEQETTGRKVCGAAYDARVEAVRSFLREAGERSPELRGILTSYPELFAHWSTVEALARVAESQQRRKGARA